MLILLRYLEKDSSSLSKGAIESTICRQIVIKFAGWMNQVLLENELVKMYFLQIAGKSWSIYQSGRRRQRAQEGKSFPGS